MAKRKCPSNRMVFVGFLVAGALLGHEIDHRTVRVSFANDSTYQIETRAPALPTLRRLELLDRQRLPTPTTRDALLRRLETQRPRLVDLMEVRFDGVAVEKELTLEVVGAVDHDRSNSLQGADHHGAEVVLRFTGIAPDGAEEFTLLYGLPTTSYRLILGVPDQGRTETQWLDVSTASRPFAVPRR